jgi:hypothetical protein
LRLPPGNFEVAPSKLFGGQNVDRPDEKKGKEKIPIAGQIYESVKRPLFHKENAMNIGIIKLGPIPVLTADGAKRCARQRPVRLG